MGRDFYDGVDASRLPTNAWGVGGYVDGLYKWSDADWARFPHSVKVRIAVFHTTDDGHVLDCEPGNCTPAQSVDWVLMRRRAGIDPTVYCNQEDPDTGWPAVRAAFQARGVPEPHYWVAHYDGAQTIPTGAVGKQHTDDESSGWDLSIVADYWPGVDPAPFAPTPTPAPPPARRNDMHVDLKLNTPVVFTNPAAVLGGASNLLLAADFGDATVRIALFSFKSASWSVGSHPVARASGAFKLVLPPDVNKVSVTLTALSPGACAGLDVLA